MFVDQFAKKEKSEERKETTNDEAKVGLAASDNGPSFQMWSDDSRSELDDAVAIGSSRQKIE